MGNFALLCDFRFSGLENFKVLPPVHNLLKFLAVDLGEPMTVDTKVIWEYLDKAIKVDGAVLRPTAVDWSALRVRAGSMTRRSMFLL